MKRLRETWSGIRLTSMLLTACCVLCSLEFGDVTTTANGQDFSMNSSLPLTDGPPASTEDKSVTQADYSDALPMVEPVVDVGFANLQSEIADLRSQIQNQEMRLASREFDAVKPRQSRRWFTTYENLLIQPLQSNSSAVIVQTDDGYTHLQFPWELDYSPRIQIGSEATGGALGWRVRYWHFDHSQSFSANDANGLIPSGNFGSIGFLTEEGDITTGIRDLSEGTFASRVRTDVIDWELQQQVSPYFDVYAGIRYGKLAQQFAATTDEGDVNSSSEFRGLGPTVAMRMKRDLIPNRLGLFANLRGSMLLGHKTFQADDNVDDNFSQSIGVVDLRSYADGMDTLVGNAEIQLGVVVRVTDWLAINTALEAQHYGNVGGANPTAVFTGDDGGINGDGPMDDSIGFAGLSVGAEVTW